LQMRFVFTDHPSNPLIDPPGWEWIIADPTFLPPCDTPDGKWHLFAHGLRGIRHYVSEDGIAWAGRGERLFGGVRPFLYKEENGKYLLFYERFRHPWRSEVSARTSTDLFNWSEPRTLLAPKYRWEGALMHTNGNPCLVRAQSEYRLYFSAGSVWLPDCGFPEPRHIGVAVSGEPLGPYEKHPYPVIRRDKRDRWRNMGAGAIKVIPNPGGAGWLGFNNGIYADREGRSRSAIMLVESSDGYDWSYGASEPVLAPEDSGWKKAFVYALDVRFCHNEWRLYYNARDGWLRGRERIGLAVSPGPKSG